jgi:hypothetical protein
MDANERGTCTLASWSYYYYYYSSLVFICRSHSCGNVICLFNFMSHTRLLHINFSLSSMLQFLFINNQSSLVRMKEDEGKLKERRERYKSLFIYNAEQTLAFNKCER